MSGHPEDTYIWGKPQIGKSAIKMNRKRNWEGGIRQGRVGKILPQINQYSQRDKKRYCSYRTKGKILFSTEH